MKKGNYNLCGILLTPTHELGFTTMHNVLMPDRMLRYVIEICHLSRAKVEF